MRRSLVAMLAVLLTVALTPGSAAADDLGFEPVAAGFTFAVNLAFAADGRAFVADKVTGEISVIDDGQVLDEPVATFPVDASYNETGLLGLALDPDFERAAWVYAYYADVTTGMNRLVRVRADGGSPPETLFEAIATTSIHDGGDLAFGSDGALFLVTGDGAEDARAQDPEDPHGKVLRLERDGSVPEDNPFGDSPVYALGIRNSFGLCVDERTGDLWETENGPESWDEVNRVAPGSNHGWPEQLGPGGNAPFVDPVFASETIIVPTGCVADVTDTGLWFGDFRGDLHRLTFPATDDTAPTEEIVASFPEGIADVARAPDGSIWVATPSTVYRSSERVSGVVTSGGDTIAPRTSTASPSPEGGFGGALGSTAGLLVLAAIGGAFLWLRSRALRR